MSNLSYIRIVGEVAEVVDERITRRVGLKNLSEILMSDVAMSSPVLPPGCRIFYSHPNNTNIFVIEQPPTIRSVSWGMDSDPNLPTPVFRLAMPYMVFFVRVSGNTIISHSCQLFCRKEPITKMNDALFAPPLPNVGGTAHQLISNSNRSCIICAGDIRIRTSEPHLMAAEFVNMFWKFGFNDDLSQNYHSFVSLNSAVPDVNSWQNLSKENQLFVLGLNYQSAAKINEVLAWNGM